MTPFPLGLDAPGRRYTTSTRQNRDPLRLCTIVAEHCFRGFARYAKRDVTGDGIDETFCNVFAQDVAEAMSVLLPRGVRANTIIAWLGEQASKDEGPLGGWEEVDEHTAQAMAGVGQLVLACWSNDNGPGHLAVVLPPLEGDTETAIAQAGRTNFTRGTLSQGFGQRGVTFFAHP